ncbi:potassium-transporting ATPase subunit C [Frigoriglobus tundricola]|uniref:Potassium-transporting ATPase C chain n=1 Tax=Frigoriglobus tundricola TaxID=2774151 RepID=A0A6M5Z589_9BACT|nr:potassium-transporting ATPase subunit C [Frigoriglobus tundricola]QJX00614.1 Potassium-transporting ATPase C chain [Frigoriglobus tundricola]
MSNHIRANAVLIGSTVVICCALYPLALFAVGLVFPSAAGGSLVNEKGESATADARGSRLIAQPFTSDEYFWPRPSAASYNATASSGSNWGANNPKLRDRVSQQLGPIIRYKKGSRSAGTGPDPRTPQQDIEAWFAAVPDRVATWAADATVGPANWVKTDYAAATDTAPEKYGLQGDYVTEWVKAHPEVKEEWQKANPDKTDEPKPEDLVALFFASFAKVYPAKWPGGNQPEGKTEKRIEPVASDAGIHANFFDLWLSDPANKDRVADLEPVPVDMVTASGSGLDPHITLRNALSVYQIDRVAQKRTASPADVERVKQGIAELARAKSFSPLSGLIGELLVNVLELNAELDKQFPLPAGR